MTMRLAADGVGGNGSTTTSPRRVAAAADDDSSGEKVALTVVLPARPRRAPRPPSGPDEATETVVLTVTPAVCAFR